MRFDEKLKKYSREQLWQEYCGYLDMTLAEYMYTQRRLMEEQIRLWSACPLGRQLLAGKHPETLEDFLAQLPLTSYADYADTLLARRDDMLCAEPAIWIRDHLGGGPPPHQAGPLLPGDAEHLPPQPDGRHDAGHRPAEGGL